MMKKEEFFAYVTDNIRYNLPSEYDRAEIRLQEITKNNDLQMTSLSIVKEGEQISPAIYLDGYYEDYLRGEDPDRLVSDIADIRTNYDLAATTDIKGLADMISNYEEVKDRLQIHLCDAEMNSARLENLACTMHGDFAATYHIAVTIDGDKTGTIPVTTDLLNRWGITSQQLHQDAIRSECADSTRKPMLFDLGSLMQSMMSGEAAANILEEDTIVPSEFSQPMFCLSSQDTVNGASLILRDDLMETIAEKMGASYYVLPSSTHEVLVVPDIGEISLQELSSIVKEVNETQVGPQDFLSDKVQYYDRETKMLENAHYRQKRLDKEKTAGKEKNSDREKKSIHERLSEKKALAASQEKKTPVKEKTSELTV